MGLRYRNRVNLGNGHGLNVSSSGVSYSKKTSWGSIGSKGFSVRTGIPGLSFYRSWGMRGKNGKNNASYFLLFIFGFFLIVAVIQLIGWVFRLLYWLIKSGFQNLNQHQLQQEAQSAYKKWGQSPEYTFFKFDDRSLPPGMGHQSVIMEEIFFSDGDKVEEGIDICSVYFDKKQKATIPSLRTGILKWYVRPGDSLGKNDFVFHIQEIPQG